jgi:hypothetical protein
MCFTRAPEVGDRIGTYAEERESIEMGHFTKVTISELLIYTLERGWIPAQGAE